MVRSEEGSSGQNRRGPGSAAGSKSKSRSGRARPARPSQARRLRAAPRKAIPPGNERLQKVLARAGLASRRACEEIILEGRVAVNGRVVDTLPALVDPNEDTVTVDGQRVGGERKVYFLLHKPRGVVCTNDDPAGRVRAVDLLVNVRERVYPVGRLDADSEGLLLMTNDGAMAQQMTHPKYGVAKTYRATVKGYIGTEAVEMLRQGAWTAEGRMSASSVTVAYRSRERSVVHITLREGRNRQVRRMLAKAGHPVRRLRRLAIGELTLRGLGAGRYRPLTAFEVRYLRQQGDQPAGRASGSRGPGRSGGKTGQGGAAR